MLLALLLSVASLQGRVVLEGQPLPGVTVTIVGSSFTAVTDADGRYAFRGVPAGSYDLEFTLTGVDTKRAYVQLHDGANEMAPQTLRLRSTHCEIVISEKACSDETPETRWDFPRCDDYELDSSLEEAIQKQERSALDLLQSRHETTFTMSERVRIAGMLLRRVTDDSRYWEELSTLAEDALKFGAQDEETQSKFAAYCAAHDLDAAGYTPAMFQALSIVSEDPRSHAMMQRALESSDVGMAMFGIYGLAAQRDLRSLDAIEGALKRFDGDRNIALLLAEFDDDRADAIAMKYIDESGREDYLAARREAAARRLVR